VEAVVLWRRYGSYISLSMDFVNQPYRTVVDFTDDRQVLSLGTESCLAVRFERVEMSDAIAIC
jgi:hypothetical protein